MLYLDGQALCRVLLHFAQPYVYTAGSSLFCQRSICAELRHTNQILHESRSTAFSMHLCTCEIPFYLSDLREFTQFTQFNYNHIKTVPRFTKCHILLAYLWGEMWWTRLTGIKGPDEIRWAARRRCWLELYRVIVTNEIRLKQKVCMYQLSHD